MKLIEIVFLKTKRVLQPGTAVKLCSQCFKSYFTYRMDLDQHTETLLGKLCRLKTASCVSHLGKVFVLLSFSLQIH